ncbi:MAG: hypothetical protein RIR04_329, partial [Pseudomonadota bacterium]
MNYRFTQMFLRASTNKPHVTQRGERTKVPQLWLRRHYAMIVNKRTNTNFLMKNTYLGSPTAYLKNYTRTRLIPDKT